MNASQESNDLKIDASGSGIDDEFRKLISVSVRHKWCQKPSHRTNGEEEFRSMHHAIMLTNQWLCVIEEYFPWGGLIYTRYETLVGNVQNWI
jgi:hypothetical protein